MLTAAVRDLQLQYPGQFATDVRTRCSEIWDNNPYLTPLSESEPGVEWVECSYPLINRCDTAPYHCLHGFIEFLNERLDLSIKPSAYKGDIHLSEQEKAWYSQIYEITKRDIPFWIIAAGGKYDIPIKWWSTERYQRVVDHFRGRMQFVQVGGWGHHHPALEGVIDLRGKTNLRELIRLVYHSQGVLCGVTSLMHLAAAVPLKDPCIGHRPCVVVAGSREPAHWEAYPGHQFMHTNGILRCGGLGGCWKDRIEMLGDGDARDRPENRCREVVEGLPHCMHLITPEMVVQRVEWYFQGGLIRYLTRPERLAAEKAIRAARTNPYDDQPLNLHNARRACEQYIRTIGPFPEPQEKRGIIICAGGVKLFANAWVCIQMLRSLGCGLPIQVWHLGVDEMDETMEELLRALGVQCIEGRQLTSLASMRRWGGWELKAYALAHCAFEQVLLLDADNVPVQNPERLFRSVEFQKSGALFWPDISRSEKADAIWHSCGIARPPGAEFESGQILVDRRRCWRALSLAAWFNNHSDFYYRYLHGDKETFHLAFEKLRQSYFLIPAPVMRLKGAMCQHDPQGQRIFQHRNTDKWNLFLMNGSIPDFWFEERCRQFIIELRSRWDGRASRYAQAIFGRPPSQGLPKEKAPRIQACMISIPERQACRHGTLEALARTDWPSEPLLLFDPQRGEDRQARQTALALAALKHSLRKAFDYLLLIEDDLTFNLHLRHNLESWSPLRRGRIHLASLYNPGVYAQAYDVRHHYQVMEGRSIFGSQAFLISRSALSYLIGHWNEVEGMQDIRISRLAARLNKPILYHAPSLVQHRGVKSTWGGRFHRAVDFRMHWRAPGSVR